jgi:hypothetical protein
LKHSANTASGYTATNPGFVGLLDEQKWGLLVKVVSLSSEL